jgi:hypothetical protein
MLNNCGALSWVTSWAPVVARRIFSPPATDTRTRTTHTAIATSTPKIPPCFGSIEPPIA